MIRLHFYIELSLNCKLILDSYVRFQIEVALQLFWLRAPYLTQLILDGRGVCLDLYDRIAFVFTEVIGIIINHYVVNVLWVTRDKNVMDPLVDICSANIVTCNAYIDKCIVYTVYKVQCTKYSVLNTVYTVYKV